MLQLCHTSERSCGVQYLSRQFVVGLPVQLYTWPVAPKCQIVNQGVRVRAKVPECLQVMESTSAAAGIAIVSFILTAVLPSTLEDILALLLAGALAYISLLSWPIKRGDIKGALSDRFGSLSSAIESEMKSELESGVQKLRSKVNHIVAPLLQTAQEELATVLSRQQQLEVCRRNEHQQHNQSTYLLSNLAPFLTTCRCSCFN